MKKNHFTPITILALVATLSCSKKSSDSPSPSSSSTTSTPSTSIYDLNVVEVSDGSGMWTKAGCALLTHKISYTGKNTYDGLSLRYYSDGTVSRYTNIDSITGNLSTVQYLTMQYSNGLLSEYHLYDKSQKDGYLIPPFISKIKYNGNQLSVSNLVVRAKGYPDNSTTYFDGRVNDTFTYNYSGGILNNTILTYNLAGNVTPNGGTAQVINNSGTESRCTFSFSSPNNPSTASSYDWDANSNSYLFTKGYSYTYYDTLGLKEVYSLASDGSTTLINKFYWDSTKKINKEAIWGFYLLDPFNLKYTLFPPEQQLAYMLNETIYVPQKIEYYKNGVLSNTVTYTTEFDGSGKITKLVGTYTTDSSQEIHDFTYTCN